MKIYAIYEHEQAVGYTSDEELAKSVSNDIGGYYEELPEIKGVFIRYLTYWENRGVVRSRAEKVLVQPEKKYDPDRSIAYGTTAVESFALFMANNPDAITV